MDRKHQAVAKQVIVTAVFAPPHQTRGFQLRFGEPFVLKSAFQRFTGVTNAKLFNAFLGNAPRCQIRSGFSALRGEKL